MSTGVDIKIGVIGLGNMGSAISRQLNTSGRKVYGFDKDNSKIQANDSVIPVGSISELIKNVGVVIIAIKPQDFGPFLNSIKDIEDLGNKIIISIAAGIKTSTIEQALRHLKAKVIRVMPSLFAIDGEGISGVCKGKFAIDEDLLLVEEIFRCLGVVMPINENMMGAVTAVSGSGPGYLAYLTENDEPDGRIEHLKELTPKYEEAARKNGFNDEQVEFFATGTSSALISYFKKHSERESAKRLCEKVTSKGGTTEAAIEVFKSKGEDAFTEAVEAARIRAEKLAKDLDNEIKKDSI